MSATSRPEHAAAPISEATPLAQELHSALARLVGEYRRSIGATIPAALAEAAGLAPGQEERARTVPPERLTWLNLHALAERDPEAAARRWEEVKSAALDELRSGHRAARAFQDTSPWERAQFLALRDELAGQWRPQGGVEWQLVETMALAQTAMFVWLKALSMWATMGAEASGPDGKDDLGRPTPRLTEAQAIDRAAAKVDRFHRMFLRTLQALCDLRRYGPTVIVQNIGQVNIGGQGVNWRNGVEEPLGGRDTPAAKKNGCHAEEVRSGRLP
jgi:hypothetical protein